METASYPYPRVLVQGLPEHIVRQSCQTDPCVFEGSLVTEHVDYHHDEFINYMRGT